MDFIKSIFSYMFGVLITCFFVGYLIGNYYATRTAVIEPNLITPHNIISMTILDIKDVKGIERYTYKSYKETK